MCNIREELLDLKANLDRIIADCSVKEREQRRQDGQPREDNAKVAEWQNWKNENIKAIQEVTFEEYLNR
jgi:hypothetical protein